MLGVVGKQRLADKVIDRGERAEWVGGQGLVTHQQRMIGMLAIHRLAQCIPGKAEHAGGAAQPLSAGIDRAAGSNLQIPDGSNLLCRVNRSILSII